MHTFLFYVAVLCLPAFLLASVWLVRTGAGRLYSTVLRVPAREPLPGTAQQRRGDFALCLIWLVPMLMLVLWLSAYADRVALHAGPGLLLAAAVAAAGYGWGLYLLFMEQRGQRAAQHVLQARHAMAMRLQPLIARDCLLLADLPAADGSIEHVVIGQRAVFVVSTCWRAPPRPGWKTWLRPGGRRGLPKAVYDGRRLDFAGTLTDAPLQQARRQAQWLAQFLRSRVGREVAVHAVVLLPGWLVQAAPSGGADRVIVVSSDGAALDFMAAGPARLNADKRRFLLAQMLACYANT